MSIHFTHYIKVNLFLTYTLPYPSFSTITKKALAGILFRCFMFRNMTRADVIGRFDPKTGGVTEYPFPNNKVGYMYLAAKNSEVETASK